MSITKVIKILGMNFIMMLPANSILIWLKTMRLTCLYVNINMP